MKKRKWKMPRRKSKKNFRSGMKHHKLNDTRPLRGGYRL